ncbi:ATP-binding protein [Parasphingorhabdus sp.]|uniref:ATP-binding protein n=1 Tax=Parasphingorhabdus sp. TaxID=2709688 RepID=UPI003267DD71
MELAIATPNSPKIGSDVSDLSLRWSARLSLTSRILAVNIFALALLAGSLFYLNNYRDRLTEERLAQAELQVLVIGEALVDQPEDVRRDLIPRLTNHLGNRVRIYGGTGEKLIDSFELAKPSYELIDPETQPWRKDVARSLDRAIEYVVLSKPIEAFEEPADDIADSWPVLLDITPKNATTSQVRLAPERTPMIIAAGLLPGATSKSPDKILLTSNARDITRIVRAERSSVVLVIFFAATVSVLLSLFLARTIIRPIRKLARAAVRVRLGREQEITIPKMPGRRDEIGQLSRALADMSGALRHRIDATEDFAADVSHEIKNPLASLRSALEGIDRVEDPDLRRQLLDVANDDVRRIDRLISDISDASRVDAELARTKFEPVDIGKMLEQLLASMEQRESADIFNIAYARPGRGVATVMGDGGRLERVFSNILDNAISFSPKEGLIEIMATPDGDQVVIHIADEGPGIPIDQREKIFTRFHSDRPVDEAFGRHSGLGLAIAKTIIEGHEGQINVKDKLDKSQGACFEIRLPKAESDQPS